MRTKGIPQEVLKLIACVAMLLDHTAAVLVGDYKAYILLRSIGRIAFPIFCFLLAEGAHYTKSPEKYALRLAVGALLAELPFDLALFGEVTWEYQSVMLTLLLGFGAIWAGSAAPNMPRKVAVMVPFILAGHFLQVDYGWQGVLLVCLLSILRDRPQGRWMQAGATVLVLSMIPSFPVKVLGIPVLIEMFGIFALIPIAFYRGEKKTRSKVLQWDFYLFYPAHLLLLWCVTRFG